jgi:hypothetical protein
MNFPSSAFNANALWSVASQTRRIFGWRNILQNWSDTLTAPSYVTTILDNLKAASDPNYNYSFNYPVSHFLSFLNNEDEGIKWLIYEAVALRWMYGSVRTDYLAALVDEVDVDTYFPSFVGSPGSSTTVRQFLESQLTVHELNLVGMMPRLVAPPPPVRTLYRTPSLSATSRAATPAPAAAAAPRYPEIQLRFIRNINNKDDKMNDDVLSIVRKEADLFDIRYNDMDANVKQRTLGLGRAEVLKHLSYSLRLLTLDEEPFASVQLIVPGMPSILLSPKNLSSSTRDLLYDTVERTMNNWPVHVV